jgi:hypothetical protein
MENGMTVRIAFPILVLWGALTAAGVALNAVAISSRMERDIDNKPWKIVVYGFPEVVYLSVSPEANFPRGENGIRSHGVFVNFFFIQGIALVLCIIAALVSAPFSRSKETLETTGEAKNCIEHG